MTNNGRPTENVKPLSSLQARFHRVEYSEIYKGRTVHFILHKDIVMPDFKNVTSVATVAFVNERNILATTLDRGIDLPGGHKEERDEDMISTVRREMNEETGSSVEAPFYLLGVIESDFYDDPSYMVILACRVHNMPEPFVPRHESHGREIVALSDFLARYTAGSHDMMQEIIDRAGIVNERFFSW